jgi:hypothetical protein
MYGFGSLMTLALTEANALDAATSFFKISLSSFNSEGGGSKGSALYGIVRSNFAAFMVVHYF